MHRTLTLVLAASCTACFLADDVGGPGPIPKTTTPLEAVPFAAIGPGKIMFERSLAGVALYVVDGTAQTSRIAFSDAGIKGATISPNGQRVVYVSYTNFEFATDIVVANIDGTGEVRVTRTPNYEGMPTWSGDGSQVVYPTPGVGFPSAFFRQSPVANPPDLVEIARFTFGSGQQIVCPFAEYAIPGVLSVNEDLSFPCSNAIYKKAPGVSTVALYTANSSIAVHAPAWSTDGSFVAFIERSSGSLEVRRMTADGANLVTLATVPTAPSDYALFNIYSVCWSADDSRIFFSVPESQNVAHIWMVRADGTGLQQITTRENVFDHNVSCA